MMNKKNIKLNNKDEVLSPESRARQTSLDQINTLFNDVYEKYIRRGCMLSSRTPRESPPPVVGPPVVLGPPGTARADFNVSKRGFKNSTAL